MNECGKQRSIPCLCVSVLVCLRVCVCVSMCLQPARVLSACRSAGRLGWVASFSPFLLLLILFIFIFIFLLLFFCLCFFFCHFYYDRKLIPAQRHCLAACCCCCGFFAGLKRCCCCLFHFARMPKNKPATTTTAATTSPTRLQLKWPTHTVQAKSEKRALPQKARQFFMAPAIRFRFSCHFHLAKLQLGARLCRSLYNFTFASI